jgi:hypothetical protein
MSDFTSEQGYAAIITVKMAVGSAAAFTQGTVECPICKGILKWHTTLRSFYGTCQTPHCIDFHLRASYKFSNQPVARQDKLL